MVSVFVNRLTGLIEEKNTLLCVGLDPALPDQRDRQVIPEIHLRGKDENEGRLSFCLEMIEETKDFCCAFKPNQQYVAGFTRKHHVELTSAIREADAISILDYKLNDIEDTMQSALFHIHRWGYDALTFNPFLGNIQKAVEAAHSLHPELGLIVLTLTSNQEAIRYQKEPVLGDRPLYQGIAIDVKRYDADGCVVGATGHITEREIKVVREIIGEHKVLLVPGVGTQKGDPRKVIDAGGRTLIINVSRDILYSNNPHDKAKEYCKFLNALREHRQ